jgi:hypothetical protein
VVENEAKVNGISNMGFGDSSPEKAGVGGSIPSLATMFSTTYRHSIRQFIPKTMARRFGRTSLADANTARLPLLFGPLYRFSTPMICPSVFISKLLFLLQLTAGARNRKLIRQLF